jgi:glycosyltransferase involved in cell wall biosynthesis
MIQKNPLKVLLISGDDIKVVPQDFSYYQYLPFQGTNISSRDSCLVLLDSEEIQDPSFFRTAYEYLSSPSSIENESCLGDRLHGPCVDYDTVSRILSCTKRPTPDTPSVVGDTSVLNKPNYVVILFSYNFGDLLDACIQSIINSSLGRKDVSVIILNDGGTDGSTNKGYEHLVENGIPTILVNFPNNKKKAHNLYWVTRNLCIHPQSILVFIDGDDALIPSSNPFLVLDAAYQDPLVEATLGRFIPGKDCPSYILEVSHGDPFLDFTQIWNFEKCWCWYHLKTYKSHLINRIEDEFFTEKDGKTFLTQGDDMALLPRALRYAQKIHLVDTPVYLYNIGSTSKHIKETPRYNYIMDIFLYKRYTQDNPTLFQNRHLPPWRKEGLGYKAFSLPPVKQLQQGTPLWEHQSAIVLPQLLISKDPPWVCDFLVFVCSYNFGDKLLRCLNSIQELSRGHRVSIIIYDDGSSELEKAKVLIALSSLSTPYLCCINSNNMKKSHNLMVLSKALPFKGDPITLFVDGDDYLNPGVDAFTILRKEYRDRGYDATIGNLIPDPTSCQDPAFLSFYNKFGGNVPHHFPLVWNMDACFAWYHLKACYLSILKKVEPTFFVEDNNLTYISLGEDNVIFRRCLDLASSPAFLPYPFYVYDTDPYTTHEDTDTRRRYIKNLFSKKFTRLATHLQNNGMEPPSNTPPLPIQNIFNRIK